MATSAYLSAQGPPSAGTVTSEHEDNGVMNLVNTPNSQGYSLPREQVVRLRLVSKVLPNTFVILKILNSFVNLHMVNDMCTSTKSDNKRQRKEKRF